MKMSVQEGIDALPIGICFIDEEGEVRLSNILMERIVEAACGTSLSENSGFYDKLVLGACEGLEFVRPDGRPVVKYEGVVYEFTKRRIEIDNETITQIMATDITEFADTAKQLEAEKELLIHMNERLRKLMPEIDEVTKKRQELDTEISLPDRIDAVLELTRKHYGSEEAEGTDHSAEITGEWGKLFG